MPPNTTVVQQDTCIDSLTDSVTSAQAQSPTAIVILGDFNTANIFLDKEIYQ